MDSAHVLEFISSPSGRKSPLTLTEIGESVSLVSILTGTVELRTLCAVLCYGNVPRQAVAPSQTSIILHGSGEIL